MSRKTVTESVSREVVTCDVCGAGQFHLRCAICKKDVCLNHWWSIPTSLRTGDDATSEVVCSNCLSRDERGRLIDDVIALHRRMSQEYDIAIARLFDDLRSKRANAKGEG